MVLVCMKSYDEINRQRSYYWYTNGFQCLRLILKTALLLYLEKGSFDSPRE